MRLGLVCPGPGNPLMRLAYLAAVSLFFTACATTPVPVGLRPDATAAPARVAPIRAGSAEPASAPAALATATLLADDYSPQGPPRVQSGGWRPGEAALQGYFGASFESLKTKG